MLQAQASSISRASGSPLRSNSRLNLGSGDMSPRAQSPLRSPRASSKGPSRRNSFGPAGQPDSPNSVFNSIVTMATSALKGGVSRSSTPRRRMSSLSVSASAADLTATEATPTSPRVGPVADYGGDQQYDKVPVPPRKILFLNNAHGSMSQRMMCELQSAGHDVHVLLPKGGKAGEEEIRAEAFKLDPDIIICPFLTKFIPAEVYKKYKTIIVHPGPLGDGGPSSIDRAKRDKEQVWGVTLLEADDVWDGGPVWAHRLVPVPMTDQEVTKSVLYRNYLAPAAVDAMWEVLAKHYYGVAPLVVDHSDHSKLHGTYRSKLSVEERAVNFSTMTAVEVAHTVAFSDSRPGATAFLHGVEGEYALFNAWAEETGAAAEAAKDAAPGQVMGKRDGAVLVRCADGSCVWIGQLMFVEPKLSGKLTCTNACSIKLPAAQVLADKAPLAHLPGPNKAKPLPFGERPKTFQQTYTWKAGQTMYVNFDFYNGAMSTDQCMELRSVLESVDAMPDVKAVVLLGSRAAFSNGVHLNVIEAAADPAFESWRNINAIDDVVRATFSMSDKLVVSALQANAGAGGAMMALAADLVWCQKDVVLNPHYKAMGLFGSEYWTHFLPARVGNEMSAALTNMCQPIVARQAAVINMIDKAFECTKDDFVHQVRQHMERLFSSGEADRIVNKKQSERTLEWYAAAERCRANELSEMAQSFTSAEYINARKAFVGKKGKSGFVSSSSPVPPLVIHQDLRSNNVVPAMGLLEEVELPGMAAGSFLAAAGQDN